MIYKLDYIPCSFSLHSSVGSCDKTLPASKSAWVWLAFCARKQTFSISIRSCTACRFEQKSRPNFKCGLASPKREITQKNCNLTTRTIETFFSRAEIKSILGQQTKPQSRIDRQSSGQTFVTANKGTII